MFVFDFDFIVKFDQVGLSYDHCDSFGGNSRISESRKKEITSIKYRCISLLFLWCNLAIAKDIKAMIGLLSLLHNL